MTADIFVVAALMAVLTPEPTFPCDSNFPITVKFLEGRGRGFVAKASLAKGMEVLRCRPYASIILAHCRRVRDSKPWKILLHLIYADKFLKFYFPSYLTWT